MREDPVIIVSTTVNTREEADGIAHEAVSRKHAACAQVHGPIISHYRWKGELCRETEWKISMKTFGSLESRLLQLIEEMHPYETPEIICMPVSSVSEGYLEWMMDSLYIKD
jgi:periplasmic divalent cation tolerance protein